MQFSKFVVRKRSFVFSENIIYLLLKENIKCFLVSLMIQILIFVNDVEKSMFNVVKNVEIYVIFIITVFCTWYRIYIIKVSIVPKPWCDKLMLFALLYKPLLILF